MSLGARGCLCPRRCEKIYQNLCEVLNRLSRAHAARALTPSKLCDISCMRHSQCAACSIQYAFVLDCRVIPICSSLNFLARANKTHLTVPPRSSAPLAVTRHAVFGTRPGFVLWCVMRQQAARFPPGREALPMRCSRWQGCARDSDRRYGPLHNHAGECSGERVVQCRKNYGEGEGGSERAGTHVASLAETRLGTLAAHANGRGAGHGPSELGCRRQRSCRGITRRNHRAGESRRSRTKGQKSQLMHAGRLTLALLLPEIKPAELDPPGMASTRAQKAPPGPWPQHVPASSARERGRAAGQHAQWGDTQSTSQSHRHP